MNKKEKKEVVKQRYIYDSKTGEVRKFNLNKKANE